MAELINSCTERESLGEGVYRQEISIKPVAYRDGNILKRINSDWGDSGISARPHIVSASQLMVSVADDGDFRVHPTRENSRYFEFGAPLIKVGGNWVCPGFGNRTRQGNRIKWETDHENAYIVHAGHYLKWGILLKSDWDRWSQFAMPVGLTGLTRQGGQLFANGELVMRLRAPVVYDYDNEEDVRQITHRFVQQDGQWYALFTLPDLTGMSKPLIDPTLELQPDATAGKDTYVNAGSPDIDWETRDLISTDDNPKSYGMIEFDLSSLPANPTLTSVTLSLWNNNQRAALTTTITYYTILVANNGWVEACTWNYADGAGASDRWAGDTGNDGGADAGCSVSGTDYNAAVLGSFQYDKEAVGTEFPASLDLTQMTSMLTANYGIRFSQASSLNMGWRTSDHATAAHRPKLAVVYTVVGGDALFSRIFAPGFRGAFG